MQKVCGRGTLRKEFSMWSGFSKVGLNLTRQMDFIKSRLVQDWIGLSHKRTKAVLDALLITDRVSAFKVYIDLYFFPP